jgi:hypothetical protein
MVRNDISLFNVSFQSGQDVLSFTVEVSYSVFEYNFYKTDAIYSSEELGLNPAWLLIVMEKEDKSKRLLVKYIDGGVYLVELDTKPNHLGSPNEAIQFIIRKSYKGEETETEVRYVDTVSYRYFSVVNGKELGKLISKASWRNWNIEFI